MQHTHEPNNVAPHVKVGGERTKIAIMTKKQNYKAEAKYFGIYWAVAASLVTSGKSRQTTRHTPAIRDQ